MLADKYPKDVLKDIIVSKDNYRPFPQVSDRYPWINIPNELVKIILSNGDKYLDFDWPSLPAVRYLDYVRDGNRNRYQKLYFARRNGLSDLVLAECIENNGRFIDDIVNGIWAICEESSWCIPAHNNSLGARALPDITAPLIDLFAAETANLLSWTYYLLKNKLDDITQILTDRIQLELKIRILDPYLNRDDFWWMGFSRKKPLNNWTTWITANCLATFLLMENAHDRRVGAVYKGLQSLDLFLDHYPPDGGCDEGPGYWDKAGGSLFDCLELLRISTNENIDVYNEPLIKEIGSYIYRAHISGNYFVNFGDANGIITPDWSLLYRYGKKTQDPSLSQFGTYFLQNSFSLPKSLLRALPALFIYKEVAAEKESSPSLKNVWLNDTEFMAAREKEGSDKGFYLAVKGGHNKQSHNHNDVGNFIIYADGTPYIIDPGVEVYSAKTFSNKRYDIWTMQSAYHNLPIINGFQQKQGKEYCAKNVLYKDIPSETELEMDISGAYPQDAGISSWRRTYRLNRCQNQYIEIIDDFKLKNPTADICFILMTPWEPTFDSSGKITLKDGFSILFDNDILRTSSEHINITDERLKPIWKNSLFRIKLTLIKKLSTEKVKWIYTY